MARKILGSFSLTMLLLVIAVAPASAVIVNFGVDILNSGAFAVTPFYATGSTDIVIGIAPPASSATILLTFNPTGTFGAANIQSINSASLFVDGEKVGGAFVDNVNVSAQALLAGIMLGSPLTNVGGGACGPGIDFTNAVSCVPVITGGSAATSAGDDANYFFTLTGSQLSGLGTDTTYEVAFFNTTTNPFHFARIDGINIQADVTFNPPAQVPEPSTLLLLGTGLVGVALWGNRRLRRYVNG